MSYPVLARPSPSRAGFTLIELTVVLAVVVIASGFVIVRVSGWSSRQSLQSSARALGNTIRTWRERARTEETSYTLALEDRSYQISSGKEVLRKGRLGGGESFESLKPSMLVFTPRGVLPETRLTIRNEHGERLTLVVGALLNEIDYQEAR
jgi:prepilin-type N-terminal cleavage/methylation domain-containing protein